MPRLTEHQLTKAVLQALDAQKFTGRDEFAALLTEADDELEHRTAQARRLRYRLGKLIDLLPGLELRFAEVDERDCCDE
jgi:hypothetical protein